MKKSLIGAAVAVALGASATAQATTFTFSGTFTMYSGNAVVGGARTPGAVTASFNFDLVNGTGGMTANQKMTSTVPFFGFTWTAHDATMTANPDGSITANIPFDWGAPDATMPCGVANCNIPVVVVMKITPTANPYVFHVTTLDGDNNGTPGTAMTAGPFTGFSPTFNLRTVCLGLCPIPATTWLFGSGLLGLVGVARRRKSA